MTKQICGDKGLKFSSHNGIVDTENLAWLVQHHMVSTGDRPKKMKSTKLEKIFFTDPDLGKKLLMVCFCDNMAAITKDGPSIEGYQKLKERLKQIQKLDKESKGKADAMHIASLQTVKFYDWELEEMIAEYKAKLEDL